jgi:hypothetical protein
MRPLKAAPSSTNLQAVLARPSLTNTPATRPLSMNALHTYSTEEFINRTKSHNEITTTTAIISTAELSLLSALLAPLDRIIFACRVRLIELSSPLRTTTTASEYFCLTTNERFPTEACVLILSSSIDSENTNNNSAVLSIASCIPIYSDFLASVGKFGKNNNITIL